MAYMRGRGTRDNPLDIDGVQTIDIPTPEYSEPRPFRRPRSPIPLSVAIVNVDSDDDDVVEAFSANGWIEARNKAEQRLRAPDTAPGSRLPEGQDVSRRNPSSITSHPAINTSDDGPPVSQVPRSSAIKYHGTQSQNSPTNLVAQGAGSTNGKEPSTSNIPKDLAAAPPPPSPYFGVGRRQLSNGLCNTTPTWEDSGQSSRSRSATMINERQRARKTVTPRDERWSKPRRLKNKIAFSLGASPQTSAKEATPDIPNRVEPKAQSPPQPFASTTSPSITAEPSGLNDTTAPVTMKSAAEQPLAMPNQGDGNQPSCQDSPVPRLMIPTDDIERARLAVKKCLQRHLQTRFEAHAYMTSSVLWRQRTCQEAESHTQRTHLRKPTQMGNHMQHVSPFKDMPVVQIRHDKSPNTAKGRLIAQDTFTKAKPNTAVISSWTCPPTIYTFNATIVPPFKEYISLNTNLLADNESKLLATPLIPDETDESRGKLVEQLPIHYEMKHDAKGPLDLRNEQCRFYKRSIEGFLEEVGMTWAPIVYWLLAPDQTVEQINGSVAGCREFETFVLDRCRYSIEEFERDGEMKISILFDRSSKKCCDFFSKLSTITAEEMRISAVIAEAVLEECSFSLWYMAKQSDLFQEYVQKKTEGAQSEQRLSYRQAVCRVCHQHNCFFHGEIREVPDDDFDLDLSEHSSQSDNEAEDEPSKDQDRRNVLSPEQNESSPSDDSDVDSRVPAHWDSDSDLERVISYRVPMNSEAQKYIPKEVSDSIKRRKPPEGNFRAEWWQNNYSTLKWDRRKPFYPCKHPGTSCDQAQCRCYREVITCEKSCECSPSCNRRFPGCNCAHGYGKICADMRKCLCVKFERECDADLCGTCGATEILDPVNRYSDDVLRDRCSNVALQRGIPRKTLLGQSTVHGFGLYAGEDIKKDDFIGEYKGEVISVQESNRRSTIYGYQQTMYLFGLNKNATYMGNKLRFINNADKKYTNCSPKNLLCNQVYRIGLFASTNIPAGTELFFNYNYPKDLTATFKQPKQAQGSVVAVKNAVVPRKPRGKARASHTGKTSSSAVPGEPSTVKTRVVSAKVIAGLQKARQAKALKTAARLAESQGVQVATATTLPNRGGPQRARKSVQGHHTLPAGSTRVSEVRSGQSSRGRSSRDSSDSDAGEGADSRQTDEVDDDEEEEGDYFPPDTQGTQESTNSYDALFTSRSSGVVEESDDESVPRQGPRRSRSSAPVLAVRRRRKKMSGVRLEAGRLKRRRSVVANSGDAYHSSLRPDQRHKHQESSILFTCPTASLLLTRPPSPPPRAILCSAPAPVQFPSHPRPRTMSTKMISPGGQTHESYLAATGME
ncbi:hypothetical protein IAQ61_009718, partial [Plenodomus lingam]|uniref:uncharacterized protein n=1 Tax=Leptosphaeria maculans TaxID=5022 RepID=UPI00332CAC41